MDNTIKTIAPTNCPHCFKEILIEFTSKSPELVAAFTEADVVMAKSEVLKRLETLNIDNEIKEEIKKWVEDEKTLFGPTEVEKIILSATNEKES